MQRRRLSRQRPHERGQTILLVAISLVSLLAMAALAIDVVTLYVARSEIQRAADATALVAAKAIADSGFTTLPSTDPNYATAQNLAQSTASSSITAMVNSPGINLVGGQLPVQGAPPTFNFTTYPGSYQVTVTLKSASLPTFFSKIWGQSAAFVTASATAEAYNPSNLATITPISPRSVKPWLVANVDPTGTQPTFVNTTTWAVDSGVIGQSFDLVSDCNSGSATVCFPPLDPIGTWKHSPAQVDYLPAVVGTPTTPNVCPLCAGATNYENSIECADVATSYQVLSCGGGSAHAQWDNTINPADPSQGGNNATALGAECLTHASSSGTAGQDILMNPSPFWPNVPFQIKAQSGPQNGNLVATSNSVVTIPIFDNTTFNQLVSNVTIVGFLQAFINQVDGGGPLPQPPPGSVNVTVLNISGCSSANNGWAPVVGGAGTSPIPVRLITPP